MYVVCKEVIFVILFRIVHSVLETSVVEGLEGIIKVFSFGVVTYLVFCCDRFGQFSIHGGFNAFFLFVIFCFLLQLALYMSWNTLSVFIFNIFFVVDKKN